MIQLTILGSGTGIPSPLRGSSSYLLRAEGKCLLLDCGPGSLRSAAAAGVTPGDVDAVVLTHFHPDHCLDLQALLFALMNPMFAGRGPLQVVAPVGFGEILDHWWAGPQGPWLRPKGYEFQLREIREGVHDVCGLEFRAIHVEHTPQSLAYRIRQRPDGPVLAYSGDSFLCDAIFEVGRDAALFLLECALPDDHPFEGHLTPRQVAEVAERAAPGRLVLTHFYPAVEGEPIEEIVRERYSGPVERAEDGAIFTI